MKAAGATKSSESIRSRTPPWPGSTLPMSLSPRSRLRRDSARSPSVAREDRRPATASPTDRPTVSRSPTDGAIAPTATRDHGERRPDRALPRLLGTRRRCERALEAPPEVAHRRTPRCRTTNVRRDDREREPAPIRQLQHQRGRSRRAAGCRRCRARSGRCSRPGCLRCGGGHGQVPEERGEGPRATIAIMAPSPW